MWAKLAVVVGLLLPAVAFADDFSQRSDYGTTSSPPAVQNHQSVATSLPPPPTMPDRAIPMVSSSVPVMAKWNAPASLPPVAQATPIPTTAELIPAPVRPVFYQRGTGDEPTPEYQPQIEIPGLLRLSRLDSDLKLQERIKQEAVDRGTSTRLQVEFPQEPILSRDVYRGRVGQWQTRQMTVEPYFVTYRNLYFQQNNFERFGWDLGPMTPAICTMGFLCDLATLPIQFAARPCERDASTGYHLPGDPVPLVLYPPEITLNGITLESAVILALVAVIP